VYTFGFSFTQIAPVYVKETWYQHVVAVSGADINQYVSQEKVLLVVKYFFYTLIFQ